jgi:hypothetical protein
MMQRCVSVCVCESERVRERERERVCVSVCECVCVCVREREREREYQHSVVFFFCDVYDLFVDSRTQDLFVDFIHVHRKRRYIYIYIYIYTHTYIYIYILYIYIYYIYIIYILYIFSTSTPFSDLTSCRGFQLHKNTGKKRQKKTKKRKTINVTPTSRTFSWISISCHRSKPVAICSPFFFCSS